MVLFDVKACTINYHLGKILKVIHYKKVQLFESFYGGVREVFREILFYNCIVLK